MQDTAARYPDDYATLEHLRGSLLALEARGRRLHAELAHHHPVDVQRVQRALHHR